MMGLKMTRILLLILIVKSFCSCEEVEHRSESHYFISERAPKLAIQDQGRYFIHGWFRGCQNKKKNDYYHLEFSSVGDTLTLDNCAYSLEVRSGDSLNLYDYDRQKLIEFSRVSQEFIRDDWEYISFTDVEPRSGNKISEVVLFPSGDYLYSSVETLPVLKTVDSLDFFFLKQELNFLAHPSAYFNEDMGNSVLSLHLKVKYPEQEVVVEYVEFREGLGYIYMFLNDVFYKYYKNNY